ncbi:glutaminyl-peptide cyclotransferase [Saccharicrinis aurantiacus]|uniref:glutaminyl-peptide cyclotransferase n=1 Tax=Saccharicrinis aurantiacus TaxID=1849719 RepID=UPI0024904000|nr:glutaminyl-peptide cyclotransferase [Saccharicrinis aurantiacus]
MRLKPNYLYLIILILFGCISKKNSKSININEKAIPNISFDYIDSYPHDTTSFTEGFLIHNGQLYESTGSPKSLPQTKSLFGIVNLKTGHIEKKVEIDKTKYFGEGITFLNNKAYQLTYKSRIGFIYDLSTFKKIKEFEIPSKEGWGLTNDGRYLIMSDGSYQLRYIDPLTMQVIKTLNVTEKGRFKEYLNELEYIKGYIFANIWTTNTIVKIDPVDGKIIGKLDMTDYAFSAKSLYYGSLEMNGIAYDSISDKTYVTGKLWPKIYEIKLID